MDDDRLVVSEIRNKAHFGVNCSLLPYNSNGFGALKIALSIFAQWWTSLVTTTILGVVSYILAVSTMRGRSNKASNEVDR